jgi:alkyl hydroperoxide reductase subunit AhpC
MKRFILIICIFTSATSLAFSALKVADIKGNIVHLDKDANKKLLLFFDIHKTTHKGIIFYAQAIYQKYVKSGLNVIGISKNNTTTVQLQAFAKKNNTRFPIILDENNKIHVDYNISHCCGATIFFDGRNAKHRFNNIVSAENLRQLVEKEMTGNIDYELAPVEQTLFYKNKKPANFALNDPLLKKKVHLYDLNNFIQDKNQILVITFFSSLCEMCRTGKRIETLKAIRTNITGNYKFKIALVFMEPLAPDDIAEWERVIDIPFERFFSPYLFSDEEKYLTTPTIKKDPFTVILNHDDEVIFIEKAGTKENILANKIISIAKEGVQ